MTGFLAAESSRLMDVYDICNLISVLTSSISDGSQPLRIKWMQTKLNWIDIMKVVMVICLCKDHVCKLVLKLTKCFMDTYIHISFCRPIILSYDNRTWNLSGKTLHTRKQTKTIQYNKQISKQQSPNQTLSTA